MKLIGRWKIGDHFFGGVGKKIRARAQLDDEAVNLSVGPHNSCQLKDVLQGTSIYYLLVQVEDGCADLGVLPR